jgi:hypothetical protein
VATFRVYTGLSMATKQTSGTLLTLLRHYSATACSH